MDTSPGIKFDRSAFSVVPLDEADDDLTYWLTRTPHERLQGMEITRQILYGYTTPPRLQRVFIVDELVQDGD